MSSLTGRYRGSETPECASGSDRTFRASGGLLCRHAIAGLALASGLVLASADASAALPRSQDANGGEVAYRVSTKGAAAVHWAKAVRAVDAVPGQGIVLVAAGAIHQDGDSDGQLDSGEVIDYHYTVINAGPAPLSGLTLSDSNGAVSCPGTSLAVGAHMICTGSHVVSAADATSGAVSNTVEVSGQDDSARPVAASDVMLTQNLAGTAGLHVFKSPDLITDPDNSNTASVGDLLRYSFVIKNANAEDLAAVNLVEPDPTRIDTAISCAATTLGGAGFSGLGSGSLASLDSVICSADYSIRAADEALGEVLNSVNATADAAIAGPINASAVSVVPVPVPPVADLAIEKLGPPQFRSGTQISFDLIVTNNGPDPAINTILDDPPPPGLVFVSNSGDCTTPFPCSLGDMAVGATRTVTTVFEIPADYAGPDPLINIARVWSDIFDPTPDNDASSASVPSASLPLPITGAATIPASDGLKLGLLALLLMVMGATILRRDVE
ncbi:MAG: DUF11 domain-containing protein [Xanthomonadales bacterium]|nr:DUF11 domain-containing protein [Xanthomonadales bacterium]